MCRCCGSEGKIFVHLRLPSTSDECAGERHGAGLALAGVVALKAVGRGGSNRLNHHGAVVARLASIGEGEGHRGGRLCPGEDVDSGCGPRAVGLLRAGDVDRCGGEVGAVAIHLPIEVAEARRNGSDRRGDVVEHEGHAGHGIVHHQRHFRLRLAHLHQCFATLERHGGIVFLGRHGEPRGGTDLARREGVALLATQRNDPIVARSERQTQRFFGRSDGLLCRTLSAFVKGIDRERIGQRFLRGGACHDAHVGVFGLLRCGSVGDFNGLATHQEEAEEK